MSDSDSKPTAPQLIKGKKSGALTKPPAKRVMPRQHGDILVKLDHLRSVTRDVSRFYVANVERDILEIVDLLGISKDRNNRKKKVNPTATKEIVKILDGISFKPEKGRRGDLKKIEKVIKAIKRIL